MPGTISGVCVSYYSLLCGLWGVGMHWLECGDARLRLLAISSRDFKFEGRLSRLVVTTLRGIMGPVETIVVVHRCWLMLSS